jgi:hypothetical protein
VREMDTVLINQMAMGELGRFHIPTPIATNGPAQGMPTYHVPQDTAALVFPHNIDPAILEESGFTARNSTA